MPSQDVSTTGAAPTLTTYTHTDPERLSDETHHTPSMPLTPNEKALSSSHGTSQHEEGFADGVHEVTEEQKEAASMDFPEGGLRAWLVISGCFIGMFFTWGYANAFGVLESYYLSTTLREYTSSDIAWISSLQYFFIFFAGLFTGRLFDAGLFKPTIGFGMVLFVFCQMMVSLSKTYWQLILSQGVGLGLSYGIIFSLSVAVPAHWFNKKRGMAFGIVAAGSSIGGVIFPIWVKQSIAQIGFPWTMRSIGFVALVCFAYAWSVMQTRLPPSVDVSNGGWKHVKLFDKSAFKNVAYDVFILGSLLVLFGMYTPFTYIDVFTETYRITASGYFLSIMNGASLFGRVLPGILADRYGKLNMLVPHLVACGILLFVFPLCTNLGGLLAYTILYGYASGCYVSLIPASVAQLGSTSNVGTRLGMMFSINALGGLFGTPIAGAILGDAQPLHWWPTFAFAGACVTAGAIAIIVARQCALASIKVFGKI